MGNFYFGDKNKLEILFAINVYYPSTSAKIDAKYLLAFQDFEMETEIRVLLCIYLTVSKLCLSVNYLLNLLNFNNQ